MTSNDALPAKQQQSVLRTARAALSRLMEPSDNVGLALVAAVGPVDALRIATRTVRAGVNLRQEVSEMLQAGGITGKEATLDAALQRWAPRVPDLAPERDLATIARLGGRLLIPEDELWPEALADLGYSEPMCLWARGNLAAGIPPAGRAVAIVGSRDSTNYGASVTGDLAAGLAGRGYTVISGGAYGIDAQAHRSALATAREDVPVPTLSVMAGGLDRYYPAGNEDLLRVIAQRGLLLAEVPPGASPTRWRFLQRNRIIAALSAVTVVVEARWRSGALNTAHHAAGLGRAVGAVPGSVHSANSAGCHRLLRDGSAICVTDAAEIAELAGPIGSVAVAEPSGPRADHDGLTVEDILLLDALPVRSGSSPEKLASVAGLTAQSVRAGLGRLELEGLAERVEGGWRKGRRPA
jgi:DNA processing protein